MLYAGLDLSRQRLDVHVLDEEGRTVEVMAVHPDADALRNLATHVKGPSVHPAAVARPPGTLVCQHIQHSSGPRQPAAAAEYSAIVDPKGGRSGTD